MANLDEEVVKVFDEIFRKLKEDSRIQTNPAPALYRHEPVEEPKSYPAVFFIEGEVNERLASTRLKGATLIARIECFTVNHDPEEGQANIRDLVKTIRRTLVETDNDIRLVSGGAALAQKLSTPRWGWGLIGPSLREEDAVIHGGVVDISVEILVNEG